MRRGLTQPSHAGVLCAPDAEQEERNQPVKVKGAEMYYTMEEVVQLKSADKQHVVQ